MSNDIVVVSDTAIQIDSSKEKFDEIEADLNELQDNLTNTAEKVLNQIPDLLDLANSAQNDKIYNALAKVLTSFSQLNRDAAEILKQKQQLIQAQRTTTPQTDDNNKIINNDNRSIVFQGTSTELLDQILSKKEK